MLIVSKKSGDIRIRIDPQTQNKYLANFHKRGWSEKRHTIEIFTKRPCPFSSDLDDFFSFSHISIIFRLCKGEAFSFSTHTFLK